MRAVSCLAEDTSQSRYDWKDERFNPTTGEVNILSSSYHGHAFSSLPLSLLVSESIGSGAVVSKAREEASVCL